MCCQMWSRVRVQRLGDGSRKYFHISYENSKCFLFVSLLAPCFAFLNGSKLVRWIRSMSRMSAHTFGTNISSVASSHKLCDSLMSNSQQALHIGQLPVPSINLPSVRSRIRIHWTWTLTWSITTVENTALMQAPTIEVPELCEIEIPKSIGSIWFNRPPLKTEMSWNFLARIEAKVCTP